MKNEHPIENLSASLYHASHVALPDVHYQNRDWEAMSKWTPAQRKATADDDLPVVERIRRPEISEITVLGMFNQLWGSTALGFGGLGGAAMTNAYTVILQGPERDVAVYWNGHLAYVVAASNVEGLRALMSDAKEGHTRSRRDALKAYGIADTWSNT